MSYTKLLFLLGPDAAEGLEWRRILTDFDVRQVSTLADAHAVLSAERMGCALVAGFSRACRSRRLWSRCSTLTRSFPSCFRKRR